MSSTTTTQYYGLTQYIGTDKPDFADNNTAFRNVDADLHQVVQDSQGFTSDIADLTERVGNLNTDLTNLSGDLDGEKAKITALQNKELSQDTEISRVERNAQDMITAYNEASATSTHAYAVGDYFIYNNVLYRATAAIAVGATIVPDTNCTTTNVTSELIQLNNDLNKGSVSVTADGIKTYKQLLDGLYTLIDLSKVTNNSKLVVEYSNGSLIHHLMKIQGTDLFFVNDMSVSSFDIVNCRIAPSSNSSVYKVTGTTPTFGDNNSYLWPAGTKFELFY